MSFRLYKASGARVPDIVSHLPAGAAFVTTPAGIVSGKVVVLTPATGRLDVAVTTNKVAGIITSTYAEAGVHNTYASRGAVASGQFPNGVGATTPIPFLPVTGTVPIIADIEGTVLAGAILPGEDLDIAAGGLTIDDATVNDDFHVVKVIDDGTNITHVIGFFNNPGYFSA